MQSYDQKIADLESIIHKMEQEAVETEIKVAEMEAKIEEIMESYQLISRILKKLKLFIRQPKEGFKWFMKRLFWKLKIRMPGIFQSKQNKTPLSPQASRVYDALDRAIKKEGNHS